MILASCPCGEKAAFYTRVSLVKGGRAEVLGEDCRLRAASMAGSTGVRQCVCWERFLKYRVATISQAKRASQFHAWKRCKQSQVSANGKGLRSVDG